MLKDLGKQVMDRVLLHERDTRKDGFINRIDYCDFMRGIWGTDVRKMDLALQVQGWGRRRGVRVRGP
eukprot:1189572-Prorocentrum_minimum.AAC.2